MIVIRSVSPSEITAVSLMQLDRLSREERSSGSVTLIRAVVPVWSPSIAMENRSSSGRGWSFIKGRSCGGSVCGTSLSRAIYRGKTSTSRRRKTGRVAYIINNYVAPRNNGHESFSLMRNAPLPLGRTTTRYEAKFGVDLFAYVRFNQQMDVTHVVWHAIGWFEGSNFCTMKSWARCEISVRVLRNLLISFIHSIKTIEYISYRA